MDEALSLEAQFDWAAHQGDVGEVTRLLREGAQPSAASLHYAVWSDSIPSVQALLDAGADPFARDNCNRTLVFSAKSTAMLEFLKPFNFDLDEVDDIGWTSLTGQIIDILDVAAIEALLHAGADPNKPDQQGYTPFIHALTARRHRFEILQLLLKFGADPTVGYPPSYSPLLWAVDYERDIDQARSVLTLLFDLGFDLEEVCQDTGQTPLARAVSEGSPAEVQVLLDLGANPNVTTPIHDGGGALTAPLINAAAYGSVPDGPEKVALLLAAAADPRVPDTLGYTTFYGAQLGRPMKEPETGELRHFRRDEQREALQILTDWEKSH